MFKKLLDTLEGANLKAAAAKGRLACPNCRANPGILKVRVNGAIICRECGTAASGVEWAITGAGERTKANPDQPPAATKITRKADASGAIVWNIPASGKSNGYMFLAILLCSLTAFFSYLFLFGASNVRSNGAVPVEWVIILFFGIFWVVSLAILYVACRNKYAKHRLTAGTDFVTLQRELFGRSTAKSLPASEVALIAEVEFYQKNYQPIYGIEIRSRRGKLRFGSLLTEEEKAWLVADLQRVILKVSPSQAIAGPATHGRTIGTRQDFFSVVLPTSASNVRPLAIVLLLMGIGFGCVGIFLMDDQVGLAERSSPAAVKVFDFIFTFMSQSFRIIWTLMSGTMAAIGVYLLVWMNRTADQETRIEGTDTEIAIRTFRHGLVLKERVFPRAAVTDIRASVSGSSNGKTMKRLELIVTDQSESVARWIHGDKADNFVEEVRRVMH